VLAVLALDPGKAPFQISAAEVLADYLPDNVPQNAIFILISLFRPTQNLRSAQRKIGTGEKS
jgi:hypothetical protein